MWNFKFMIHLVLGCPWPLRGRIFCGNTGYIFQKYPIICILNFIFKGSGGLEAPEQLRRYLWKWNLRPFYFSRHEPVITRKSRELIFWMSPFIFPYSFWVSSPKILSLLGGFFFCPIFTQVTLVNMMLKISEQSLHPGWWIFAQTSWCTLPQQNCKPLLERKGRDLAHSVAALCSSAANRSLPCWTLSCHSFSSRSGPHQQVSIIQSTPGTQSPTLMAWGIVIKQLVGRTVWCL